MPRPADRTRKQRITQRTTPSGRQKLVLVRKDNKNKKKSPNRPYSDLKPAAAKALIRAEALKK